jgi:hypothetical protein
MVFFVEPAGVEPAFLSYLLDNQEVICVLKGYEFGLVNFGCFLSRFCRIFMALKNCC